MGKSNQNARGSRACHLLRFPLQPQWVLVLMDNTLPDLVAPCKGCPPSVSLLNFQVFVSACLKVTHSVQYPLCGEVACPAPASQTSVASSSRTASPGWWQDNAGEEKSDGVSPSQWKIKGFPIQSSFPNCRFDPSAEDLFVCSMGRFCFERDQLRLARLVTPMALYGIVIFAWKNRRRGNQKKNRPRKQKRGAGNLVFGTIRHPRAELGSLYSIV